MIRGFFFDLDGTLVDTHQANFEAYRSALADFGYELTFEQFKTSIGHQARTFLPWFAPDLGKDDYEAIAKRKAEYYQKLAHLSVMNKALAGFLESLTGVQTVLVTSAKEQNARLILAHHRLETRFSDFVFGEDVARPKPDPEAYELALKKTGLSPGEAIVFEDSDSGREAAEGAGIAVVLINGFKL